MRKLIIVDEKTEELLVFEFDSEKVSMTDFIVYLVENELIKSKVENISWFTMNNLTIRNYTK
jgi:hypothetical protein